MLVIVAGWPLRWQPCWLTDGLLGCTAALLPHWTKAPYWLAAANGRLAGMVGWLTGRLGGLLACRLAGSSARWLVDSLAGWLVLAVSLIGWLFACFRRSLAWFAGRVVGLLAGLFGRFAVGLIGWKLEWFTDRLARGLDGWLAGRTAC